MSSKKKPTKDYPAARKFALRSDATVRAGERSIEEVYGLPRGSVQLVLPSGKVARSDKRIGRLLADWDH